MILYNASMLRRLTLLSIAAVVLLLAAIDQAEQTRMQAMADVARVQDIALRKSRGIQPTPEDVAFLNGYDARRSAIEAAFKKTAVLGSHFHAPSSIK